MVDYKKLYFALFNTLTRAIEAPNLAMAQIILRQAQENAEEMYLQEEDHDENSAP